MSFILMASGIRSEVQAQLDRAPLGDQDDPTTDALGHAVRQFLIDQMALVPDDVPGHTGLEHRYTVSAQGHSGTDHISLSIQVTAAYVPAVVHARRG